MGAVRAEQSAESGGGGESRGVVDVRFDEVRRFEIGELETAGALDLTGQLELVARIAGATADTGTLPDSAPQYPLKTS